MCTSISPAVEQITVESNVLAREARNLCSPFCADAICYKRGVGTFELRRNTAGLQLRRNGPKFLQPLSGIDRHFLKSDNIGLPRKQSANLALPIPSGCDVPRNHANFQLDS